MFGLLLGVARRSRSVRMLSGCVIRMLMRRVIMLCGNRINVDTGKMVVGEAMGRDRTIGEGKCYRRRNDTDSIKSGNNGHRSCSPSSGQPSQHARSGSVLLTRKAHTKS